MKRNKNWHWAENAFINGCNQVELKSWRSLHDFLSRHGYVAPKFIFRGQSRHSYELCSPLYRALQNIPGASKSAYFEKFRMSIRGRGENIEHYSDNELWILGLENGLKTPLIEWTQSSYIAGFFAFYPEHKITINESTNAKELKAARSLLNEPRVLYMLNRHLIEQKRKQFRLQFIQKSYPRVYEKLKELAGNLVSLGDPYYLDRYIDKILNRGINITFSGKIISACETATWNRDYLLTNIIEPRQLHNPKFITQASVFTMVPIDYTLEEWVIKYFIGCEENVLIKIIVPNEGRRQYLKMLNQMNINSLTLFPDLQGSARYCNDWLDKLL